MVKSIFGDRSRLVAGAMLATAALCAAPGAAQVKKRDLGKIAENDKPVPVEELGFEVPQIAPGPPMTLPEVLEAVDKNNRALVAGRMEIEKVEARLSQAYAYILPFSQATLTYSHNDHSDTANFGADLGIDMPPMVIRQQEDLKGMVQVGMNLIHAEGWATISAAKRGVALAKLSVEEGRQIALHQVAQGYYMALMAKELIDLRIEQALSAAHHLKVAKARLDAGTGLKIDVLRAETDLETAHQELISANLGYETARDALTVATGTQQRGLLMPVLPGDMVAPQDDETKLAEKASGSRADIARSAANIALLQKQLDVVWLKFVPTLNVGWGLQYQFTETADLGSPDRSRWSLIFTLTVPIYNHQRYAELDLQRIALRQAMLQQDDIAANASLEVRRLRREYLGKLSALVVAERQKELAKQALTLIEASYAAGTGSSLEVTDAHKTRSMADVNATVKRFEVQNALLSLLKAIGQDMSVLGK
ncbi:MAG: TolC family protein [Myxococcota bacterium]|nr:TolC family protein [Myxococcota bacterium]